MTSRQYSIASGKYNKAQGAAKEAKDALQSIDLWPKRAVSISYYDALLFEVIQAQKHGAKENIAKAANTFFENQPCNSDGIEILDYLNTIAHPNFEGVESIQFNNEGSFFIINYLEEESQVFITKDRLEDLKIDIEKFTYFYRPYLLMICAWVQNNNIEKGKLLG